MDHLIGNAAKARAKLGWEPSVDFKGLIEMMVDADLERVEFQKRTRQVLTPFR